MNEGLQTATNKVVLVSRNVLAATNNVGFNTAEALPEVKVFDDDDYMMNEDATEHKYLHR